MLLAVNIGNTNIRFGLFKPNGEILSWTLNSKFYSTEDEIFAQLKTMYEPLGADLNLITEIAIGSVVPRLTDSIALSLKKIHRVEPFIVDRYTQSNVTHHSKQIGTDLYANAVAAQRFYKGKKIIIDFGTALTFTAVDESGKISGVVISPGIITSLKSLIGETAQLPEIELKKPEKVLGNNTENCMQSGMINGFLSLVEGMIDRINQELDEESFVIATGGMSSVYAPLTPKIQVQDTLHTIKGIAELYQLNSK